MNVRKILTLAVAAVVVVAAGLFAFGVFSTSDEIHQTAYFTAAKGIYTGDDVRILGVKVGSIDSVTPQGDGAKISYSYDAKYEVPNTASAAIIAPSVVASRFIQLAWTPAQNHAPYYADNSEIPIKKTAVPLEFDDVKVELTKLADALGPKGANAKGALNRLIQTGDNNLAGGNAQLLHDTITKLDSLVGTLNNSKGDLFGTIKNLNSFIGNLNANDAALRQFSADLDSASGVLNDDRRQLAVTLDSVNQTFKTVSDFLQKNRTTVKQTAVSLAQFSQTIAYSSKDLAEILHVAPTALDNFYNIYDQRYNALTGRFALTNLSAGVGGLLCGAIASIANPADFQNTCTNALKPLVDLLNLGTNIPGVPGSVTNPTGGPSTAGTTNKAASAAPAPKTTNPLQGTVGKVSGSLGDLVGLLLPGSGS